LQSEYDKAIANAASQLKKFDIKEVTVSVDYAFNSGDAASFARETVRALISESYVFDELKNY
jgi:leucyl aminopeptidase